MIKYLFLIFLLSGCAVNQVKPKVLNPSEIKIVGWAFDREHFTDNMKCHDYFMNSAEELKLYLDGAESVSKRTWEKSTRQAACMIKVNVVTDMGRCSLIVWEYSIKGKLTCPEDDVFYLIGPEIE